MASLNIRRWLDSLPQHGPVFIGVREKRGTTTYRVFSDGSLRHFPPKVRGKAARKAEKRARRRDGVRLLVAR